MAVACDLRGHLDSDWSPLGISEHIPGHPLRSSSRLVLLCPSTESPLAVSPVAVRDSREHNWVYLSTGDDVGQLSDHSRVVGDRFRGGRLHRIHLVRQKNLGDFISTLRAVHCPDSGCGCAESQQLHSVTPRRLPDSGAVTSHNHYALGRWSTSGSSRSLDVGQLPDCRLNHQDCTATCFGNTAAFGSYYGTGSYHCSEAGHCSGLGRTSPDNRVIFADSARPGGGGIVRCPSA